MAISTRLAALVVKTSQDGTPLVLVTVPSQADVGEGDFTYTTPTCKVRKRENEYSVIAQHVCQALGILRADVVREEGLNMRRCHFKGKMYKWFFFQVATNASVTDGLTWVSPHTYVDVVRFMSKSRKTMFEKALSLTIGAYPELMGDFQSIVRQEDKVLA